MPASPFSTQLYGSKSESVLAEAVLDCKRVDYRDDDGELALGEVVGDYRITAILGRGGMGAVYAAKHPLIGKEVAIKVVHRHLSSVPLAKKRFIQEARALTQIEHPNVVEVYSFGELTDGRSYLIMELIRGDSMGDLICEGTLTVDEILDVLDQLTCALSACHEQGVVHRDIKPDNVFVFGRGPKLQVKLIDFGIAKVNSLNKPISLTTDGLIVGTPAYMAPEQVRGDEVDSRCDIYSVGVVAYEALTGHVPFAESTIVETMTSILNDDLVPISKRIDCPPALDQLVNGLMAKNRKMRPAPTEIRSRVAAIRAIPVLSTMNTVNLAGRAILQTASSSSKSSLTLTARRAFIRAKMVAPLLLVVVGLLIAWRVIASSAVGDTSAPLEKGESFIAPLRSAAVPVEGLGVDELGTKKARSDLRLQPSASGSEPTSALLPASSQVKASLVKLKVKKSRDKEAALKEAANDKEAAPGNPTKEKTTPLESANDGVALHSPAKATKAARRERPKLSNPDGLIDPFANR